MVPAKFLGLQIVWAGEHRDRRYDEGGRPGRVAPLVPLDALAGPQEPAFCRRWEFTSDEYLASPAGPPPHRCDRSPPCERPPDAAPRCDCCVEQRPRLDGDHEDARSTMIACARQGSGSG